MLGFLKGSPHQDEAQQSLDRAVAILRGYQRAGAEAVSVDDVLRLLGAEAEEGPAPLAEYLDPQADALTGCLPVTPQRP
jgi:hypothetical protein